MITSSFDDPALDRRPRVYTPASMAAPTAVAKPHRTSRLERDRTGAPIGVCPLVDDGAVPTVRSASANAPAVAKRSAASFSSAVRTAPSATRSSPSPQSTAPSGPRTAARRRASRTPRTPANTRRFVRRRRAIPSPARDSCTSACPATSPFPSCACRQTWTPPARCRNRRRPHGLAAAGCFPA